MLIALCDLSMVGDLQFTYFFKCFEYFFFLFKYYQSLLHYYPFEKQQTVNKMRFVCLYDIFVTSASFLWPRSFMNINIIYHHINKFNVVSKKLCIIDLIASKLKRQKKSEKISKAI